MSDETNTPEANEGDKSIADAFIEAALTPRLRLVGAGETSAASLDDDEPDDEPEGEPQKPDDRAEENLLRPTTLVDFVGQEEQIARLKVAMTAARKRESALPHLLVSGPAGLGKTTIAQIVANEMGGRLIELSAPGLKAADLITILMDLHENDVVLVDEIHRIKTRVAEEVLYPAMEDFKVNIVLGQDENARPVGLPIKRFTLVGATTNAGHLPKPLQDRFGLAFTFEFYKPDALVSIIRGSAARLAAKDETLVVAKTLEAEAAATIAASSRGTPRVANRLLQRVLDFALASDAATITEALARDTLKLEGIDGAGLNPLDRRYLKALLGPYQGGPAGLSSLAAMLQEDAETLAENVEPFLTHSGYILRTPQGRVATEYAAVLYGQPA